MKGKFIFEIINLKVLEIIDEIKSGYRKNITADDKLKLKDFLYKDKEGKTLLEYILQNKIEIEDYFTKFLLSNNLKTLKIFIDNNVFPDGINDETLNKEIEPGVKVIELLFRKKLFRKIDVGYMDSPIIVDLCIKYDKKDYLENLSEELLFTKAKDIYVIERLIKDNLISNVNIINVFHNVKIIDILVKYDRKDLLVYISDFLLLEKKNGKTIIEQLIDMGIVPIDIGEDVLFYKTGDKLIIEKIIEKKLINDLIVVKVHNHIEIIDILIKYNRKDLLKFINLNEDILLKKNGDKSVIENLLDMGIVPKSLNSISNIELIKLLYKLNRPDLLVGVSLDNLLTLINDEETYLEYVLKSFKLGIDINITKIDLSISHNKCNLAKKYILFDKYDLLDYLKRRDEKYLLNHEQKEKSLLEELVIQDVSVAKRVIEYFNLSNNYNVVMFLKFRGIETSKIDLDMLDKYDFSSEYIDKFNRNISSEDITEEAMELLNEFKNLMSSSSDKKLLNAVLLYYRYFISKDYELALNELKRLIEIKKHNPDFSIMRHKNNSCFNLSNGNIYLDEETISTIGHEITHALHFYLSNYETPNELVGIVNRLRNNPKFIEKVKDYSIQFKQIEKMVTKRVEEEYSLWEKEYYTEEKIEELKKFLSKTKYEQIEKYRKIGYSIDDINVIFNEVYTLEEYMESQKRIKCKEKVEYILRSEFSGFIAIGDIIDGIFGGIFRSDRLNDLDGNPIEHTYGHGIHYYFKSNKKLFSEALSDYSQILKSLNSDKELTLLKNIIGEEYFNLIRNFYINNLIYSEKYSTWKEVSL